MEYIFHETQDGSLCAQHCLNSLLQGDYYSAVDLANIARELDNIEMKFMSEGGTSSKDYERFINQESSNYDDTGFFSIQVLQKALKSWNLDLIPYTSQNELATEARKQPTEQKAYICNFKEHWYTIRKLGNYWFNLNSLLKQPELISDTHLSVLLAQLESDGYSIFIVDGDLPKCQADIRLCDNPLDVKEVLALQSKRKSHLSKSKKNNKNLADHASGDADDYDDDELKKAIEMSLYENDLELDSHKYSKLYPSLAHESMNFQQQHIGKSNEDEEEQFKKAIAMSLENTNKTIVNNEVGSGADKTESADEIRRKRLEFLDKKS